jgi:zeaxanthin glucosyltransferase
MRQALEFISIGNESYPESSLALSLAELRRRHGLAALHFTIQAVARTSEMMLRESPAAIKASGISMLLVDQTEPAKGTIADRLRLPFVTICNALALNRDPNVPPPFTSWPYMDSWFGRARNRAGYFISDRFTKPIWSIVNRYRRSWGLRPHACPDDSFSTLAQISQQPSLFDYPRRRLPRNFHYAGPFRGALPAVTSFPWEKLNGRVADLRLAWNFARQPFACLPLLRGKRARAWMCNW